MPNPIQSAFFEDITVKLAKTLKRDLRMRSGSAGKQADRHSPEGRIINIKDIFPVHRTDGEPGIFLPFSKTSVFGVTGSEKNSKM